MSNQIPTSSSMTGHKALIRLTDPNLALRLSQIPEAANVDGLRSNPAYSRLLSEVSGTTDGHCKWIEDYSAREIVRRELYPILEPRFGVPCGALRLHESLQDIFLAYSRTPFEVNPAGCLAIRRNEIRA